MPCMSVTLDVSRLSDWLNADALCRVERKAYHAGRSMWCMGDAGRETGKREVAERAACWAEAD